MGTFVTERGGEQIAEHIARSSEHGARDADDGGARARGLQRKLWSRGRRSCCITENAIIAIVIPFWHFRQESGSFLIGSYSHGA